MLMAVLSCGWITQVARAAAPESPPSLTPAALADLLENPQTRQALIDQLRAQSSQQAAAGAGNASASAPAREPSAQAAESGLQARISDGAQKFLSGVATDVEQGVGDLHALAAGQAPALQARASHRALLPLGLAIAVTLLVYFLLKPVAIRINSRIDRWVGELGHEAVAANRPVASLGMPVLYRRAGAILGAAAVALVGVALVTLAGSAAALWASPDRAAPDALAVIFLKTFVAVEIVKVLVRLVFAIRHPHLRLMDLSDAQARYWNRWFIFIAVGAGYGTLVVDPVLSTLLSPALGRLAGMLIMLVVYIYAVRGIWSKRLAVRHRLEQSASHATTFLGARLRLLSRTWHVLGISYFTVLLVVSQIDPVNALPFMARATAQTLLAIGVGSLVVLLVNTLLAKPIRLSEELHRRLPLLEARINAYVPASLKLISWIVRLAMLLVILDAWHAFNLSHWLTSDAGGRAIRMVLNVVIVLLSAALVWTLIASFIEHRLSRAEGQPLPSARERTLLSLFRNAALIVIVTLTAMVLLSQIGINVGPLIAGAGVVGLAIGFGAQKLVQDIITGVFIQLENGMNENDVVEIAGVFGTVEKMTIRSVGIRTLDGGYHLVPFSSVDVVANHMRDFSYHLGEYTVSHRESVDDVIEHLRHAFAELMTDPVLSAEILDDITIPGVTSVNEKGVTVRVLIKTSPGMQWAVQRGYNRLVKKHFDAAGIELPYPHMVMYFGQDKHGYAPSANVTLQEHRPEVRGSARAAGQTPRRLRPSDTHDDPAEVLGNEGGEQARS